ncbi:FAD-dependent oxidoreductase [Pontibacter sp. 172403-2]|uniref:flavin monoamine oxidase family protein n=1 Tax=Pontibacter rufus TaxID=2791028 RepID=UPI0018AF6F0D|nr:NAD(P)/FAD-dependent oxidoreductase [Pontibacter sp. 172403-2]MBF9255798.1 FAD-dependent oxidoreductase [Pontibacter sp. 172403-2]
MKTRESSIIIGGGLSGLTLAYLLAQKHIEAIVLEASPRLGGRIQTVKGALGAPLELGATWFADKHRHLSSLSEELELQKFPQFSKGISLFQTKSFEPPQKFFVPEAETPSYRLAGGTQSLIDTLAQKLKAQNIRSNARVTGIRNSEDTVIVETATGEVFKAGKVIVCVPPQLAASQIEFSPELPKPVREILPTVQTWMAGAVKFTLEYSEPFWRNEGFSGMLYSHAGIVTEMYDHTNLEEDKFGFTGFLNSGAAAYAQEVRKEFVLRQLGELLGAKALQPTAYFDKVWTDEFVLAGSPVIHRPHQNNGHALLQMAYMDGKLYFCGTETATEFAGYMEGAVMAAKSIAERL